MILKRFYDEKLAQASYLVGCAMTGEALVVDPNRDVEQYVRAAEAEGLEITHITETHIHADYVSGSRELAERTAARLYLSDEGDENWKYAFAKDYDAVLLKDGDTFKVGNVLIEALHTPGHTPEHLTFLVTDTAGADRPIGAFTGDFVFVGDVGRPDLLEKVANFEGTMEAGARTLFHSLQRFREQPDWLQIWPGHGAGSACGKGLSAVPHSTVGYERMFNWGLASEDEDEFVQGVLAGQPEPPKYFARMKQVNRDGPRLMHGIDRPQRLSEKRLPKLLDEGALVVDTRSAADFAGAHIPGTINVPLNRSFTKWAGWLIPYDRDIYLLVDDRCPHCLEEAVKDLAMIGLDDVAGYFAAEVVDAWIAEGRGKEVVPQVTSSEVAARMDDDSVAVLDVREPEEWEAGHLPGVPNIPLGHLLDRLDEVPRDRPVVVHCQAGPRGAIAASLLQSAGVKEVLNLAGGYEEWRAGGQPTEKGIAQNSAATAV